MSQTQNCAFKKYGLLCECNDGYIITIQSTTGSLDV